MSVKGEQKKRPKKENLRFTKAKIIVAIEDSGGIILNIARKLKCDWHTAHKYVNMYPETLEALEAENEIMLDNAEMSLHNQIAMGDARMICYYLSTKGKKRGYVEQKDVKIDADVKSESKIVIKYEDSEI